MVPIRYCLAITCVVNAITPHTFQREVKEQERLKKFLEPAELALAHPSSVALEEHLTSLHENYQQLEAEYRAVIEKLAASDL